MKKFINDQETVVDEMLEGLGLLYEDKVEVRGKLIISRELEKADRVTIVAFGGAGHGPAQYGFVGDGMLNIHVLGDVFISPSPKEVLEAIHLADKGHGIILMVLNHAGDMLTGNMVYKLAQREGIKISKIITQDDIGVAPRSEQESRRGMSGVLPLYHILGAAAKEGKTMEEIETIAQKYIESMATIGVVTSSATNSQTGQKLGEFGPDDMEVGAGQHGEGGGAA